MLPQPATRVINAPQRIGAYLSTSSFGPAPTIQRFTSNLGILNQARSFALRRVMRVPEFGCVGE
jgi:hypothetical protein